MFGLRESKKNGFWGGIRRIISEWRTGFGEEFIFRVGLFAVVGRSVEALVVGGGIRESRKGNGGQVGFVFRNEAIVGGRDEIQEGLILIVLGDGKIDGRVGGLGCVISGSGQ